MSSPAQQSPMRLRLPKIADTTDELFEIANKAFPQANNQRGNTIQGPGRYGEWLMYAHSPKVMDICWRTNAELYSLIAGQAEQDVNNLLDSNEIKRRPNWKRMALMQAWMQLELVNNQFVRPIMIESLTDETGITAEQLLFIDQPDCDMWSDDERLVLKFSKAAFNFEMTDELFEAAVQAWGPEQILASLYLCAQYWGLTVMLSATGCDRYVGMTAAKPLREQTGRPNRDPSYKTK